MERNNKRSRNQIVLPKHQGEIKEQHQANTELHCNCHTTRQNWNDVERTCQMCDICAAGRGPRTRSRGQMKQYNVGAPFERIAIDIAGPFPVSDAGNRYLLLAMDYFTKWPEVYAIPNQEAATVADVLVKNFFCRFGVPRELHSDQGRYFESKLMQEVLGRLGVRKTRTTPLHPQSVG